MSWTKVISVDSLSSGKREVVKVGNKNVLLINHEGQIYALENACPHLKLSLKNGKITEDGAIVCPWHRSAFSLETGAVKEWITFPPVMNKVMTMVSKEKALTVFPIKIENGDVWVNIDA